MFDKPVKTETSYYVVRHSDNLFAVMSRVKSTDSMGRVREYKNFVAETETEDWANKIIAALS